MNIDIVYFELAMEIHEQSAHPLERCDCNSAAAGSGKIIKHILGNLIEGRMSALSHNFLICLSPKHGWNTCGRLL